MTGRTWRQCFRLTRYAYWRLRDDALDRGMTASTYAFWLLMFALRVADGTTKEAFNADIAGVLEPDELAEWTKDVEKGLRVLDREGVPW